MPKREHTIEFHKEQIKKIKEKEKEKEKEKKRKISKNIKGSEIQLNNGDVGTPGNQLEVAIVEPGPSEPVQLQQISTIRVSQPTAPPPPQPIKMPIPGSELLSVLDDVSEEHSTYGNNIHEKLASKWQPILIKGLDRNSKSKILSGHTFPQNCKWLRAPVLNDEAQASEKGKMRDDKIAARQDQLGKSIAAISKAMTLIILDNDNNVKESMEALSDGCKLLADLHYMETQSRIELIKYCVPHEILPVIENQNRDDYLFGVDLRDKLKLARVRQSYQQTKGKLRKTLPLNSPRPAFHDYQGSYGHSSTSRHDPGWDYRDAYRLRYNISRMPPN